MSASETLMRSGLERVAAERQLTLLFTEHMDVSSRSRRNAVLHQGKLITEERRRRSANPEARRVISAY